MQAPPPDIPPSDADPDSFQEMEVVGVRVEQPAGSPVAVLREVHGSRRLSIWVDAVEATAIAFAHQGIASLRPLTHDLFRDVLDAVDVRLVSARITSLADQVFHADLALSNGSNVPSRPGDAIALAVRTGAPILVANEILAEVGVAMPDDQAAPPAIDPYIGKAEPAKAKEPPKAMEPPTAAIRRLHELTIHDSPTAVLNELRLVGVRVEMPSNSPIMLLKESDGSRYFPIWIGAVEATAIAAGQQRLVSPRPLTHDLLRDVLEAVGVRHLSVRINALSEGIFYSDLVLSNGSNVSSRPSDGVALAVRTGAKIEATTEMLDAAGVEVTDDEVKDVGE
jgi:uncharacterized protein